MTEGEWLACADPVAMLDHLGEHAKSRRHRLFGLACCERVLRFFADARLVAALEFAERHVEEGVAGRKGRSAIEKAACAVYNELDVERDRVFHSDPVRLLRVLTVIGGSLAAERLVNLDGDSRTASDVSETLASSTAAELALQRGGDAPEWNETDMGPEKAMQATLARDIFGNPFRPVGFAPIWRTPEVSSLARQAYDAKVFASFPILADALEEAGCADGALLSHLRGPGPHVRGCWVLDLILGKG